MTHWRSIYLFAYDLLEGLTTGPDVVVPATVLADDFMIVQAATEAATSTPSGWTHLGRESTADYHHDVYYRVLDGSEASATVTFGGGSIGDVQEKRGFHVYRNVDPITPIEDWDSNTGVNNAPSVSQNTPISMIAAFRSYWRTSGGSFNNPETPTIDLFRPYIGAPAASENLIASASGTLQRRVPIGHRWALGNAPLDHSGGMDGYDPADLVATGEIDWNIGATSSSTVTNFTLSLQPVEY